jgi:DNA sulfur modification protein DndE
MLANIKTSKENKELVTKLTQKLNLGAENIVARLAFSYSLNKNKMLELKNIQDSEGKEYSARVLFGNYETIYISLIATMYNLHSSDKNISRYIKMHIDDGLILINKEVANNDLITGNDFLINEFEEIIHSIKVA